MMKPIAAGCATYLMVASATASDTGLDNLKRLIVGSWTSIACELRPQPNLSDPALAPQPTYLTRDFRYDENDQFDASITVYANDRCTVPAATYVFAGDLVWHGENPAAAGAWSQDYVLNKALSLTVKLQPMADQLNALPNGACGDGPFVVGEPRDILGKPCVLLKFAEGNQHVVDHDFLYVRNDTPNMLFMGGKHVDGTGFYFPENRPTVGLQQPLIRID